MEIELVQLLGDCRTIANCAWTSTISQQKKEQKSESEVERVVKMLIKDKHTSPLESVVMTFDISVSDPNFLVDHFNIYKNAIAHVKKDSKVRLTLNFHALIKYRFSSVWFNQIFEFIKTQDFIKYCVIQLEEESKN